MKPRIRQQHILMAPPVFWLVIFLIVPLVIILLNSLGTASSAGGRGAIWSTEHYQIAFRGMYLLIFLKSFYYALISTILTLLVAFPMAYYMAFASPRMKMLVMLMIILPFWTNFLIRMYSLMTVLGDSGFINTVLLNAGIITEPLPLMNNTVGMYIGFIYWNLPFMVLPIFASLDRMDVSLLEASFDLGASHWQTFRKITLPWAMPGLVTGIIFTFIPTLGNFVIPEFLGGTGNYMIGNVITAQFLKTRNGPFGSALSTVLVGVVLVFISLYLRFYNPSKEKDLIKF